MTLHPPGRESRSASEGSRVEGLGKDLSVGHKSVTSPYHQSVLVSKIFSQVIPEHVLAAQTTGYTESQWCHLLYPLYLLMMPSAILAQWHYSDDHMLDICSHPRLTIFSVWIRD
jgi:hypothetical protein